MCIANPVDESHRHHELEVLKHLRDRFDENEDGNQHVVRILDHFDHQGPNGLHHCIVAELLGPSLASHIDELYDDEIFPPELAKRFVFQVALGVKYLHKRNVVHGGNAREPILVICAVTMWFVRPASRQHSSVLSQDDCLVNAGRR